MSARCRVCSHESRAAIEQALMNGKPKATVAKMFGFTYTRRKDQAVVGDHKVLENHLNRCMGEAYQKALEDRELASGEAMITRIRALEAQVDLVIERANKGEEVTNNGVPLLEQDGSPKVRYDNRLILNAVAQGRANIELMAKLAGKTEGETGDLDEVRRHLTSPEARRLLAKLDELAATRATEG